MPRARILEDGTAYFGPEDAEEVIGKAEKPKADWTEVDRGTFDKLMETIQMLASEGKDFDEVRVRPQKMDYETEVNYRKKGDDDTKWKKKLFLNQTQADLSDLEPDTEYEIRLRHRFVEKNGSRLAWQEWSPISTFRTESEQQEGVAS